MKRVEAHNAQLTIANSVLLVKNSALQTEIKMIKEGFEDKVKKMEERVQQKRKVEQ